MAILKQYLRTDTFVTTPRREKVTFTKPILARQVSSIQQRKLPKGVSTGFKFPKVPGVSKVSKAASAAFGPIGKALTFTSDLIERQALKLGAPPPVALAAGLILAPENYLTFGLGFLPKVGATTLLKIAPKLIKLNKAGKIIRASEKILPFITKLDEVAFTSKVGREMEDLAKLRKVGAFARLPVRTQETFYKKVFKRALVKGEKNLLAPAGKTRLTAGIPFTKFTKDIFVGTPKFLSKVPGIASKIPAVTRGVKTAVKVADKVFSSPFEKLDPKLQFSLDRIRASANREMEYWNNFAGYIGKLSDRGDKKQLGVVFDILRGTKKSGDSLAVVARKKLDSYAKEALKLKDASGKPLLKAKDLRKDYLPRLYDQFLKDTNLSYRNPFRLSVDELSRLKKISNVPKYERLSLGEVKNPGFAASVAGLQISQLIYKSKMLREAKKFGFSGESLFKNIGKEVVRTGKVPKELSNIFKSRRVGIVDAADERNYIKGLLERFNSGKKISDKQFVGIGKRLLRNSDNVVNLQTGQNVIRIPKTAQYGELAGSFVPKSIWDWIQSESAKPQNVNIVFKALQALGDIPPIAALTGFFKRGATILNPALIFLRNPISNQFLSFIEEPASFKAFHKAANALRQGVKNKWFKMAQEDGLLDAAFFGGEIQKFYNNIANLDPNRRFKALKGIWEALTRYGGNVQQGFENLSKLQLYIYALERGASREQALRIAERGIFAYHKVSPEVRILRKSGIPFLTFAVKSAKQTARVGYKAPGRLAVFPKAEQTYEKVFLEDLDRSDEKYLPEWQRDMLRTRFTDEQGNPLFFSTKYFYPWGNFFEGFGIPGLGDLPFGLGINPLVTLTGELAFNESSFFKSPIREEGASPSEQVQQVGEYVTRQLGPTFPTRFISQLPFAQRRSRRDLKSEILSSVGLRFDPFRVDEQRQRRINEVNTPEYDLDRRLKRIENQRANGSISQEEYRKRVDRAYRYYEERTKRFIRSLQP